MVRALSLKLCVEAQIDAWRAGSASVTRTVFMRCLPPGLDGCLRRGTLASHTQTSLTAGLIPRYPFQKFFS